MSMIAFSVAVALLLAFTLFHVIVDRNRVSKRAAEDNANSIKLAAEQAAARAAAQAEYDNYVPIKPHRIELEDGQVAYEAASDHLVRAEQSDYVSFFQLTPVKGSGFPGMPETQYMLGGVVKRFLMKEVIVDADCAPYFDVHNIFGGQKNLMWVAKAIPATAFAHGKPQPDYGTIDKGVAVSMCIKNTSDKSRAFRARIVGTEVDEP